MTADVTMEVVYASQLSPSARAEIHRLCNEAYGEDLSHLFAAYTADFHALARWGNKLVGHGMVVTRWLQVGDGPLLRAAYVELVATAQSYRGRGIGRGVMRQLAQAAEADGYDLAALCPADTGMYGHLGWEYWQGPLFIRGNEAGETSGEDTGAPCLIATPEERVMILRLSATPPLDLTQPLSAEWRAGGELW